MKKIREASEQDRYRILKAIDHLKQARDLMLTAGAKRSTEKIRSAIKSSGGALRHIDHALRRAQARELAEAGITQEDLDLHNTIARDQRRKREGIMHYEAAGAETRSHICGSDRRDEGSTRKIAAITCDQCYAIVKGKGEAAEILHYQAQYKKRNGELLIRAICGSEDQNMIRSESGITCDQCIAIMRGE